MSKSNVGYLCRWALVYINFCACWIPINKLFIRETVKSNEAGRQLIQQSMIFFHYFSIFWAMTQRERILGLERVWIIKYWSSIRYLKKFEYGSSRVRVHIKLYQKTLAAQAKWSIDTKVWNVCLWQRQVFHGHRIFQHFYHVTSFKSINIVFETGKYHSWPNTLPVRVGYWGANTRTPGSIPSTRSSPSCCELHAHSNCSENKASIIL